MAAGAPPAGEGNGPRNRDALIAAERKEAEAERLGERLPGLLVRAERVAMTIAQGVHGRRRVGQGETFWQYRPYAVGDAARDVDWRRSARSDALFVRETEWEAAQSVWLWRDSSPSMAFSSAGAFPEKGDRADLVTIALAALLLHGGERVGLLDRPDPPGFGRSTLTRLATSLLLERQAGESLPDARTLPRHAQVVLIGDMLSEPDLLRRRIAAYADRGISGVIFQILDPAEEALPYRGRIRFSGMEGEGETVLDRVESLRERYFGRMSQHRQALQDIARLSGWRYLVHHTDKAPESALLSLYEALDAREGRALR